MNIKTSRGFSLLEIVIAMLILSLVVTGMVGLFVSTNRFIIQAGHRLAALNYARQVAETLKPYVSATATVGPLTNAGTGDGCALDGDGPTGELHEDPHIELDYTGFDFPNITTSLTGVTNQDCDYTVDENVVVTASSGGIAISGNTDIEAVIITVSWTET